MYEEVDKYYESQDLERVITLDRCRFEEIICSIDIEFSNGSENNNCQKATYYTEATAIN